MRKTVHAIEQRKAAARNWLKVSIANRAFDISVLIEIVRSRHRRLANRSNSHRTRTVVFLFITPISSDKGKFPVTQISTNCENFAAFADAKNGVIIFKLPDRRRRKHDR